MTSCGGTVSVTVRRSIRTMRSTIGIRKISPGPFCAIRRPSRKMTPRSYSRRIRIPEARTIARKTISRTTIAMTTPTSRLLSLSTYPARLRCIGGAHRRDVESQPLHRLHAHSTAALQAPPVAVRGPQLRAPKGALHEDLSDRIERLANLPDRPDHLLPAGAFRLPARPDRPLGGEGQRPAQEQPHEDDHNGRDLECAVVRVVQQESRGDERHHARGAKDAVRG